MATRYYELNTWLQCIPCNQHKDGRYEDHEAFLRDRYGDEFIWWTIALKNTIVKFPPYWYEEQIEYYQQAVALLDRVKAMGGKTPPELFTWNKDFRWNLTG